jgi:hypothetical protein
MCESSASFSSWIDTHHSFDQSKYVNYHAKIILVYGFFRTLGKLKSSTLAYT